VVHHAPKVWLARPVTGGQRRVSALVYQIKGDRDNATSCHLRLLGAPSGQSNLDGVEQNERIFMGSSSGSGQLVGTIERDIEDWCTARLLSRLLVYRE
jgi:hypothetical protein